MREVAILRGTDPDWPSFVNFFHQYTRNYANAVEVNMRFDNFKATIVRAAALSKLNPRATFGINKFADQSTAEFASTHLMPVNITQKLKPKNMKKHVPTGIKTIPDNGDWTGVLTTPVKDQGACGSCWAFSATQTIESANIAAGKGTPDGPFLGPEQIVDCDSADGGCGGGDPRSGMTYVQGAGGQETESNYPYVAGTNGGNAGQCSFNSGEIAEDAAGGPVDVSDGTESALLEFLQQTGPPSVAVDASSWQSYTGGVLTTCGCNIDHAVQAVGVNADGMANSFKIRNSWNTDWGVNGFIYLQQGSNMCCVANEVSWATV